MVIFLNFSPTLNRLHPLQGENCDCNSRLVVDGDDMVNSGLKGSNRSYNTVLYRRSQPPQKYHFIWPVAVGNGLFMVLTSCHSVTTQPGIKLWFWQGSANDPVASISDVDCGLSHVDPEFIPSHRDKLSPKPSKHKTFVKHLYNIGPTSKTSGRRLDEWVIIGDLTVSSSKWYCVHRVVELPQMAEISLPLFLSQTHCFRHCFMTVLSSVMYCQQDVFLHLNCRARTLLVQSL